MDIEKIRNEIANTRRQIDLAEMKIEIAPESEKDEWRSRLAAQKSRFEKLERKLEEAEKAAAMQADDATVDAVPVFDDPVIVADGAQPIYGEPTESVTDFYAGGNTDMDPDAILRSILNADDPDNTVYTDPSADAMADAMIQSILTAEPDGQGGADAMADAMIQSILNADEGSDAVTIDDATADAMLDSIINAPDPSEGIVIDDATADAMLESILNAQEQSESDADEPIMLGGEEPDTVIAMPSDDTVIAMPAENGEATAQADEPIVLGGEEPDTVIAMPSDDTIIAMPSSDAEEAMPEEATDRASENRAASEKSEEASQEVPSPSAPNFDEMADALLGKILSATDSIVAERKQADVEAIDSETRLQIEKLKLEAEDANRRAQAALFEAEKMRAEAAQIKLEAETERAMFAAEMELRRGLRNEEDNMRAKAEQAEKDRLAEKIARRKAEITAIRNGLQDVKDTDSAFLIREKLFSVQLVLDEDERNSPEISYLLTKSMDDVSHSLEVAELKRRIAALVAMRKAPPKKKPSDAAKKKAAAAAKKKKLAAKKKAAAKKKRKIALIAAGRRPVGARPYPPAQRRYVMRPSSGNYNSRYLR